MKLGILANEHTNLTTTLIGILIDEKVVITTVSKLLGGGEKVDSVLIEKVNTVRSRYLLLNANPDNKYFCIEINDHKYEINAKVGYIVKVDGNQVVILSNDDSQSIHIQVM